MPITPCYQSGFTDALQWDSGLHTFHSPSVDLEWDIRSKRVDYILHKGLAQLQYPALTLNLFFVPTPNVSTSTSTSTPTSAARITGPVGPLFP